MVLKGLYDNVKMNILTPDPIRVIRFGEILGEIDSERPYDEMVNNF